MQGVSSKRVAIFTTFSDISEAYSLNRVVQDQMNMLLDNGYEITVIVAEGFKPKGVYLREGVTLAEIPNVPVHNEVKKDETFDEDVQRIYLKLKSVLQDIDVVLTHDVIYQNAALKHNFASRKIAEEMPKLKWLHWIHSATSPLTLMALRDIFSDEYMALVQKPFPNSFYVFFNDYSVPRVAHNFGVSEEVVRVVHHPSDLREVLALSEDVYQFARDKDLFSADVICVYPVRLDTGKQVEVIIKTMAMLKQLDLKVRLVVVDFHSTGGEKIEYRDFCKSIAIDWGLNQAELIWTSEYKEEWKVEIPHSEVMGIMRLANVFMMPSVSESYSLITQEAGLNKCIMVLNFDFPPFRDIFGPDAIYRKYSSNIDMMNGMDGNTNTAYGPGNISPEERKYHEKLYHSETAGMIAAKLRSYKSMAMQIRLRKFRNLDFVFKHELEPLLSEEVN
jgi:glycosyltransferase involved in cell wall biosynthesis